MKYLVKYVALSALCFTGVCVFGCLSILNCLYCYNCPANHWYIYANWYALYIAMAIINGLACAACGLLSAFFVDKTVFLFKNKRVGGCLRRG